MPCMNTATLQIEYNALLHLHNDKTSMNKNKNNSTSYTIKPCPEAHMDMILFEVFLKSINLIPQQILQRHYSYYR